ncbi:Excitatory amino acid transporter 2 like protein [Verticillium longisporum]|uniref:Excitatory amino acid transporter 2 like protein n=1 Tax=Verticillium longisporum TaxID=100787 RepID=A0A8I3AQ98_VERLO|nr:Excitatory amino acid transporter 2 like protein [Verticillium longisporum]
MGVDEEKRAMESNDQVKESSSYDQPTPQPTGPVSAEVETVKKPWWHSVKEPGSATQIVIAAALAIGIGLGVSAGVGVDNIPEAAPVIIGIPGSLWLRALRATVLPLIICAMILAIQRLREVAQGAAVLAKWTISYYVLTTILAIAFSIIMTSQIWEPMMENAATGEGDSELEERKPHQIVQTLFFTLIPQNVVYALANDELLAILVTSIIVGYLIKDPATSAILRAVIEVEVMITRIITFLIKLAPIGVSMLIHLWVILPILFFAFTRKNPYPYWAKSSPAWLTAWGTASSAATLPVTLRVVRERGVPTTVNKFAVPLGCLINMDGTAIYFPMVCVFMAATQGIKLDAGQYIMILLLSTLSAIGTTPIPSSSLVLTLMITSSVGIPETDMFAVVVAIDWFIDRFRTMVNVSGDIFAAGIIEKMTGVRDPEDMVDEDLIAERNNVHDNTDRV